MAIVRLEVAIASPFLDIVSLESEAVDSKRVIMGIEKGTRASDLYCLLASHLLLPDFHLRWCSTRDVSQDDRGGGGGGGGEPSWFQQPPLGRLETSVRDVRALGNSRKVKSIPNRQRPEKKWKILRKNSNEKCFGRDSDKQITTQLFFSLHTLIICHLGGV